MTEQRVWEVEDPVAPTPAVHYCGHPARTTGRPCRQIVDEPGVRCIWHDPYRQEEARAARRRGAESTNARSRRVVKTADPLAVPGPPKTIEDAIEWASWAVWAVATGGIDARTAHECGYVLRAFLDGRKHLDSVDTRVKELSAKIRRLQEDNAA
jgi:hypothetical protein